MMIFWHLTTLACDSKNIIYISKILQDITRKQGLRSIIQDMKFIFIYCTRQHVSNTFYFSLCSSSEKNSIYSRLSTEEIQQLVKDIKVAMRQTDIQTDHKRQTDIQTDHKPYCKTDQ